MSGFAVNRIVPSFELAPGRILARKYEVLGPIRAKRWAALAGDSTDLGLYLLQERDTGIERTGKFFFSDPNGDARNAGVCEYAQKLHKLRHVDILMQYRTQENVSVAGERATMLVSDYVEGQFLPDFLADRPFSRLTAFEGLHFLHALVLGVEQIHQLGEHVGELMPENILVRRYGLGFKVKLIDLETTTGRGFRQMARDDATRLLHIFKGVLGGPSMMAKQPEPVRRLLATAVRSRPTSSGFRDASELRVSLETLDWQRPRG